MSDETRRVKAAVWMQSVEAALVEGFRHFDFLTACDEAGRGGGFSVHLRLVNTDNPSLTAVRISCEVPRDRPELDSVASLIAGASWHERETTDFFGIKFRGGSDEPLLLREHGEPPLRKDAVLGARVVTRWPGARVPGEQAAGRRSLSAAGVPDAATWGERDPQQPPPTTDEIAASFGRSRSRRPR